MRALSIAATGMLAQQTNVEVIANNLANMNTTGFKQQRAEFQDLLYQNVSMPGANSSDSGTLLPSGVQIGAGVRNRRDLPRHQPGRSEEHRQSLRRRDPGAWLLPHPAARRHRRLHPLRRFRPVAGRSDRRHRRLHPLRRFRPVAGRSDRQRPGLYGGPPASPFPPPRCRWRSTPRARCPASCPARPRPRSSARWS